MTFSRRSSWALEPNALSASLDRRRAAGLPVLDLTESNPTRAGLGYPEEALRAALAPAGVARYQPEPRGLESARQAVAGYYRRRGLSVAPERILLTASTSEGYAFAFKLLCDPGDRILVPAPSYPLFAYLAVLESVRVDTYPLVYHGGWEIDLQALEDALRASPPARLVVVVSPNNPTGSFLKRHELEALRALGAKHGFALVADEVFGDYGWGADPQRVGSVATEEALPTFTLSGLSKVAGLPQVKLGWMLLSGSGAEESMTRLEVIADTYLSVGTPVQLAAPALLAEGDRVAARIRARVGENQAWLSAAVPGTPVTLLRAEGGWYGVLRLPSTWTEERWVGDLLDEEGVLLHPGHFFDFAGEPYAVASLLTEPPLFREGIGRLLRRVGPG